MEFAAMAALLATVAKVVDLVQMVKDGNYKGAATQVGAYVAGIAVVVLFAKTDYASALNFGGHTLATVNLASQVVIGVAVASAASLTHDGVKAVSSR